MLNDQVGEVQAVGRRLAALESSPEKLYDAVRRLDRSTARALKDSAEADALAARPVVLLRYEILRRVLAGVRGKIMPHLVFAARSTTPRHTRRAAHRSSSPATW
jgi:hypothetical protein